MADADNLEILSNAELRAKCMQHGLPNVPVTDSSRKVLIKKLRVSMGSPAIDQKKSNRRETIHVAKETTDNELEKSVNRTPGRPSNRRTIAATPTAISNSKEPTTESNVTAAPISNRRRSSAQEASLPQKKTIKPVERPVVIIESDDEEDDLVLAALQAEKQNERKQKSVTPTRTGRAPSLSKTGVTTTSFNHDLPPLREHQTFVGGLQKRNTETVRTKIASVDGYRSNDAVHNGAHTLLPELQQARDSFAQPAVQPTYSTTRYSSLDAANYYSPPTYRPSTTAIPTTLRTQASSYYNEQSDDTDATNDEAINTPFLSDFARKLQHVKTESIGRRSMVFGGGSIGTGDISTRIHKRNKYSDTAALQRPNSNDSLSAILRQYFIALDHKYQLKRNFVFLFVILFIILLFIVFWQ